MHLLYCTAVMEVALCLRITIHQLVICCVSSHTIKTDKILGLILLLFSVMFLCPRCCGMLFVLVLLSCNSSSCLLDCRTCRDKEKIDCIQLVYMPSIHLVKCCVGGSHSLEDCHILSVMYFPIMFGFSGVAYLKILVPEFLIFKECIVGKHLVWWGRASSIARCCRRYELCICI